MFVIRFPAFDDSLTIGISELMDQAGLEPPQGAGTAGRAHTHHHHQQESGSSNNRDSNNGDTRAVI
jgi:hypothetical protein